MPILLHKWQKNKGKNCPYFLFDLSVDFGYTGGIIGKFSKMLIKKGQAKIVDQKTKIIRKYTASDKQLEVNYMTLNGRTPEKAGTFLCEAKVHFMAYVTKGNGKIFLEEEIFEVGEGDCIDVPAGTKFAAEGNFEYITAENPAWYPEQAQIVDKNGNKV